MKRIVLLVAFGALGCGSGAADTAGNLIGTSGTGVPVAGVGAGVAPAAGVAAAGQAAGVAATAGTVAGLGAPAGVGAGAGLAGSMAGVQAAGVGGMGAVAGSMPAAGTQPSAGMEPVAGMQPAAGTEPAAGTQVAAGTGSSGMPTVTIELTTVEYGGQYAPQNYGAVWFEDASGTFIKTAKRWAGTVHASDLVAWTEASGGWGSFFLPQNEEDQMDAISQATIRNHESHTIMWNMMDTSQTLVPDGEYVVVLEMTEDRASGRAGPVLRIPFTKGPAPQQIEAPDQEGFSNVSLSYAP